MNNNENKKVFRYKIISLIVIIIILIILFIVCGISFKSTPEGRKKKIISYLEKKYNSKFEIVKLVDSGENIIIDEINCDGSIFCPKITDKGVYYYVYEIRSVKDNVTFKVKYLDRRLFDKITEQYSYYSLINKDDIEKDINDYVVKILGNNNMIKTNSTSYEIRQNFDDICNTKYVEKLNKISKYVAEKNKIDKDLDINVYLEYEDGIQINITSAYTIYVVKRSAKEFEDAEGMDIVTGEYIKIYKSIDEYLKRWKK